MAKKVEKLVKLQIPAGKATTSSTSWTSLLVKLVSTSWDSQKSSTLVQLNQAGMIIPVVISVYEDKIIYFRY